MGSADRRTVAGSQALDGSTAIPATPCRYHPRDRRRGAIRGPSPLSAGIAADEEHLGLTS
jgi:hypothetical protein